MITILILLGVDMKSKIEVVEIPETKHIIETKEAILKINDKTIIINRILMHSNYGDYDCEYEFEDKNLNEDEIEEINEFVKKMKW